MYGLQMKVVFILNGFINNQTSFQRIWYQKPQIKRGTVWCAISRRGILVPYTVEEDKREFCFSTGSHTTLGTLTLLQETLRTVLFPEEQNEFS